MRRLFPILILIVVIVAGVFSWRYYAGRSAAGKGAAAGGGGGGGGGPPGGMQLPVEAMTVQPEPVGSGLATVGTLRADEWVVVRPEIAGRISKIHFDEGQLVKAGAVLFSLDSSIQRASLREAQANLDNARRTYTRSVELSSKDLISRAELDNAQAQLAVAEARVESARALLEKTSLLAPFSGMVGLREVSVGAWVNFGTALVNLVRMDPMEVDFSVPETALGRVKVAQPITVTVDAFSGESFSGEVTAIDPMMDVNSRSAKVRAQIANTGNKLRPGLFARIGLGSEGSAQALLVPEQALLQQGETRFVYKIVDGKAARAEIKTGRRVPGKVEVVEGLKAGDQVITAGQGKPMMHEGMPVMVLPQNPQAPGGAPGQQPGAGGAQQPGAAAGQQPAAAGKAAPAGGAKQSEAADLKPSDSAAAKPAAGDSQTRKD